jgi:hypothetical protein
MERDISVKGRAWEPQLDNAGSMGSGGPANQNSMRSSSRPFQFMGLPSTDSTLLEANHATMQFADTIGSM